MRKAIFLILVAALALAPAALARVRSHYCGAGDETPGHYAQGVGEGYYAGVVEFDDVVYADAGVVGALDGAVGGSTPADGEFLVLTCTDYVGGAGKVGSAEVSAQIIAKADSSALDDLVANSTTRTMVFTATRSVTITAAEMAFYAEAASTLGTVLGNLKAWDASADAEHNLLETADFDMEGMTAKEGSALTLQTTNPEYLELDVGDTVYWESVSNNADMTGGTDGALTFEFTVDE
ncbi:MAG: hypothetical protein V3W11_04360 [bacterium]